MKKIITLLTISILGVVSANAELRLGVSDIKSNTDKGYILSDNYLSNSDCIAQKNKNNEEYTSYKRSECFKDETGYKYFICKLSDSCEIGGLTNTSVTIQTTDVANTGNTTNSTTKVIVNQDKLDKFLSKVVGMKSKMTIEKYENFLNTVIDKLNSLGTKYSSNPTITEMVGYLATGVKGIKEEFLKNKDVDNFFCELTDSCTSELSPDNSSNSINDNEIKSENTSNITPSGNSNVSNEIKVSEKINISLGLYGVPYGNNGYIPTKRISDDLTVSYSIGDNYTACKLYGTSDNKYYEFSRKTKEGGGTNSFYDIYNFPEFNKDGSYSINLDKYYDSLNLKCYNKVTKKEDIVSVKSFMISDFTLGGGACILSNLDKINLINDGTTYGYTGSLGSTSATLGANNSYYQCLSKCGVINSNSSIDMFCHYEGQLAKSFSRNGVNYYEINTSINNNTNTKKTCAGGTESIKSSDNSQSCTFSWTSKFSGEVYNGTGTNGGTISGTCGNDGNWVNIIVSCPIKPVTASSSKKTFTQEEVTSYINQVGKTNYPEIAKAIINYEGQGYTQVREQVAKTLGVSIDDVNNYLNGNTSTTQKLDYSSIQSELNNMVKSGITDGHVYAKWIIGKEDLGYTGVREMVSSATNGARSMQTINDFLKVNYNR